MNCFLLKCFVMVVMISFSSMNCVGQETVSVLWRAPLTDLGITSFSAPAIDNGRVFLATDRMRSYDRETGRLLWSGVPGKLLPHGVTVSGALVFEAESRISAIRKADGAAVWSVPFDRGGEFSTPVIGGNRLIVGTDQGRIVALDSQTGVIISELKCDPTTQHRSIVTGLTVQGDTIYVSLTSWDDEKGLASHGLLVAVDLTGTVVRWTFRSQNDRTRSGFTGSVYFLDTDVLAVDGLSNRIYKLSHDGHQLWVASGVARSFSVAEPLLIVDRTILMGSADANVYAIDSASGQVIWHKLVHGSINAIAHCGRGIAVFDSNMSVLNSAGDIEWGPFPPGPEEQFSSRLVTDGDGLVIAGPAALYSLKCSEQEKVGQ